MPTLNVSELNLVISVLVAFIILFALISVKVKTQWYLGEALPAVVVGIILGPYAAKFLEATELGSAVQGQQDAITLGLCRVVIGVQLVIVGFQLPAKYQLHRWKEILLYLIPNITLMWLCTSGCVLLAIPKLNFLSALVIGSCVTSTNPILSQAIAKGPFADRYVARDMREIISSEAGANDGFGFPFLMLATYLLRYTQGGPDQDHWAHAHVARSGDIDGECYMLFPAALRLFLLGTCGCIGTNDLLACFSAGSALNWDRGYLAEAEACHDEVNSCIDSLLNFGGFMYIGAVIPIIILLFQHIPSTLALYKFMPKVYKNWKEALFMGYFGPIRIGAVFYAEHAAHLFPVIGGGQFHRGPLDARPQTK
ncbi:hypothetical protein ASPVEDRAFT_87229 [Aspergillus versicolor CBS 583.65]|uniref:Cation/H+ exchanger transmembrane domain-containing protein n=1 Tax=Aspergillus versicolor CBS 583.65 TaxID=1036611 RepID=A0A1L9PWJ8_ASPVE|nr:uncharacterized protein ASPVEDRAFT_87229 [Aspergillus versicolor CBS 583.65]OJJ05904.1 hypothetical protein ASPVEDRAFT_87229 [Aspergillus versicolor CBS 583.65]